MKNQKNDKLTAEKLAKSESVAEQIPSGEKATEKGQRSRRTGARWTVLDTVIVLMVLLVVAGAVVRSLTRGDDKASAEDHGTYYVDFIIPEIHASVLEEIEAFDALYCYETGTLVGYVGAYDDGSIALRTISLAVGGNGSTVSAEGSMVCLDSTLKNGSLLVPEMDTYLTPGTRLTLCTEKAVIVVEISSIYAEIP